VILTERLELAEYRVVSAARLPAGDRGEIRKSDALDAARIARAVLGVADQRLRTARTLSAGGETSSGTRIALRVLSWPATTELPEKSTP